METLSKDDYEIIEVLIKREIAELESKAGTSAFHQCMSRKLTGESGRSTTRFAEAAKSCRLDKGKPEEAAQIQINQYNRILEELQELTK